MSYIYTHNGHAVEFYPDKSVWIESIDIEDIAHSLAQLTRFNGHGEHRYSVARHCINCARLAPKQMKLAALLHDAAEAYLGDVATPLKENLRDYRRFEEAVEEKIRDEFFVENWGDPWIGVLDKRLLKTEAKILGFGAWEKFGPYPELTEEEIIRCGLLFTQQDLYCRDDKDEYSELFDAYDRLRTAVS